MNGLEHGLETKFADLQTGLTLTEGAVIAGYASLFGTCDRGGDVVCPGAFAKTLATGERGHGRSVKMLWQHDPTQPIGVWDDIHEDTKGLWVKGRILEDVARGREARALIEAGALDGLSIGYRTVRATKNAGGHRLLSEVELWEVSLVTFPMLPQARLDAARKSGDGADWLAELAGDLEDARRNLAARAPL